MKLRSALMATVADLPHLVERWELPLASEHRALLAKNPRLCFETIYNVVRRPAHTSKVLGQLTEQARAFVELLVYTGGDLPLSYARQRYSRRADELTAALQELTTAHLLYFCHGETIYGRHFPAEMLSTPGAFVSLPDTFLRHVSQAAGDQDSLLSLLKQESVQRCRNMLGQFAQAPAAATNEQIIWMLYGYLLRLPPRPQEVAMLPPAAAEIFRLLTRHGRIGWEEVGERLGVPMWGSMWLKTQENETVESAIRILCERPFCFEVYNAHRSRKDIVLPREWRG